MHSHNRPRDVSHRVKVKIDKVKVKIYFQHVLITICSSRKSLLSVIAATIDPPASSNGLSFVFNSKLINWEKTEDSVGCTNAKGSGTNVIALSIILTYMN
jgi:hypothetical protein